MWWRSARGGVAGSNDRTSTSFLDRLIAAGWLVAPIALVALWEVTAPRRHHSAHRSLRWPTSFTLGPVNALVMTLPITAVALASAAGDRGWGVLNALDAPRWIAIALAVPLLDLLVYVQHRLLHAVPALWAFHRVHHADFALDVSTGLRFHPIEAALTHVTVLMGVVVFGLPALGVITHQAVAMAMTLFEHANGRLPAGVESRLQRVIVTPAMHRIHHSPVVDDTDSNFATIFPLWDRWLGTYRARAAGGDAAADVGLFELREPKYATLPWTLLLPFVSAGRGAAVSASDRR